MASRVRSGFQDVLLYIWLQPIGLLSRPPGRDAQSEFYDNLEFRHWDCSQSVCLHGSGHGLCL